MFHNPYFLECHQRERERAMESFHRQPRHIRPSLYHRIRKGLARLLRRPPAPSPTVHTDGVFSYDEGRRTKDPAAPREQ
ncbi:hypothetical protein [Desmospora profundinema]|uniref:Uncharacterized protein n=1 Tax=Desmospora profundinema TaxID=1571184 RepID=A0ABU1IQJ9_9BACL|nr:hypothetical protein [Desmospora profundinema]MDR6227003.1 hypothetical protein [Desmospora profundinema]